MDDTLWSPLFEGRFSMADCDAGFARAYRRRTLEERRAAQEAEQQRRHWRMPSPGFAAFPPPGVAPFGGMPGFPSGVPGIIGGDFDRTPGLLPPFHAPRGFPEGGGGLAGGVHPPGAVPPGARYDPISPLIDPDGQSGFGGGIGPMGPRFLWAEEDEGHEGTRAWWHVW
mmetsp:Transcript_3282/g.7832  ORF Transcript_3282/g.7832 Transcript_3282/m.7832 type:complete len:169 (-) Transcript_3282:137-643(-)